MAENTKKWEEAGRRYRTYIKLEKRLSKNTVESYMRDLRQFAHFILRQWDVAPHKVEEAMIERYMAWLYDKGREKTSQARALSGVKSFFNFLMISDKIEELTRIQVDAIKNLNIDKITVWDSMNGQDGSPTTANFLSGMMKSIPPLSETFKMAGLEIPTFLGKEIKPEESDSIADAAADGKPQA